MFFKMNNPLNLIKSKEQRTIKKLINLSCLIKSNTDLILQNKNSVQPKLLNNFEIQPIKAAQKVT